MRCVQGGPSTALFIVRNVYMPQGLKRAKVDADGSFCRIGIISTRWNFEIVNSLLTGCLTRMKEMGVKEENITQWEVAGSYELPQAAKMMLEQVENLDAVICIGVLIKGETMHFEYIADAVSKGIMRVSLDAGIPVVFGVLTCLTEKQAIVRAGLEDGETTEGKGHNHGIDWGATAVEMANIKRQGNKG